jgi:hypothetical protein
MSKITNSKKIAMEDFKDQRPWIERLLAPLNQFLQDAATILNNGILLKDNVMSQEYTISLVSDGARTSSTFSWKWNQKQAPSIVIMGQLLEVGSTSVPPVGFTWSYAYGSVTCTISGLSASKDYNLKVVGIS